MTDIKQAAAPGWFDQPQTVAVGNASQAPAEGDGHAVIEHALTQAIALDPGNSPIELDYGEGVAYQRGMVAAYQHALEMIPRPNVQPKGMPAEWLDAFEEWRQTLGAADLDGKRDLVWRHIAGTGFQAGAAWARSQAPAPGPVMPGRDWMEGMVDAWRASADESTPLVADAFRTCAADLERALKLNPRDALPCAAVGDEMLEPLVYAAMMHSGIPKTVAEFERAAANVADMLERRAAALPHPGSPEADKMLDALLAEYGHPANAKNAARAGYMAARRLLQHARHPLPASAHAEPVGLGGTGWQPIETAPQDTQLLLAAEFDRPGDWRIKMGYFDSKSAKWAIWGASWRPTRWMPLPAAPGSHVPVQPMGDSNG